MGKKQVQLGHGFCDSKLYFSKNVIFRKESVACFVRSLERVHNIYLKRVQ
jgi:hypothetical protein